MMDAAEPGSFRDRDGFVFYRGKEVYRAINHHYRKVWDDLTKSSFFNGFLKEGKIPGYETAPQVLAEMNDPVLYQVLKLQKIPFISYPCEWSLAQLRNAALLTLEVQKKAMSENFSLKDASAFNVQFIGNKAVFIDLQSFEPYTEGEPWVAYRQFCCHFLAPLLLWHHGFPEIKSLFIDHIDGIPLKTASVLLPWKTRFDLAVFTHIHLHARFESRYASKQPQQNKKAKLSKEKAISIVTHLEQTVRSLKPKASATNWTSYYDTFSYTEEGFSAKKKFVEKYFTAADAGLCADLGANTGEFSFLAAEHFKYVVACDSDLEVLNAIEKRGAENVLPVHVNLVNPTPSFGWNLQERSSILERIAQADLVMALALVHHLCIGNNVPLSHLALFFAGLSKKLIIEFVPKSDPQVKKLLVSRKDIFDDYSLDNFKSHFSKYFEIEEFMHIPGSDRVIFFLTKKVPDDQRMS